MRVELAVCNVENETGNERRYEYSIELPNDMKLENVEAHAANMFRVLDAQASQEDDGGDSEAWKSTPKS